MINTNNKLNKDVKMARPRKNPLETLEGTLAPAKIIVSPVYGPMHHPFLNLRIDGLTELPEIDSWTQCQLDAQKLTLA